MSNMKNKKIWLIWLGLMAILIGYFAYTLTVSDDKTIFMPGDLTGGHHQIGVSCVSCHGESFSDEDSLQNSCIECHGEQREKPFDSHPREKFTDPRNADRLENINALYCVTCHVEHQPEMADETGLTQAKDFCVHCHENVADDRPSHEGMEFDTCASSGCHNYHNNRSLYTDFLVKHMDEEDILKKALLPEKELASVLDEIATYPHDRYPVTALTLKDIDAPAKVLVKTSQDIRHDWLTTAHANIGANCSSCHLDETKERESNSWIEKPDHKSCVKCHDTEVSHFMQGKHGMRLKQNLPAMTPFDARLPMKDDASHKILECNSCHQAHQYELDTASVESCLSCHDDKHSLAYKESSHYSLWKKEQSGELPKGSGVSCASCHMPRVAVDVSDWLRRTVVQHNQNVNLVPNDKMIRSTCLNCHGLEFSIDSLADESLISNNFNGKPTVHIESIDMARKENERHLKNVKDD